MFTNRSNDDSCPLLHGFFCQPFDFLFLDEPVSHLDEINANNMARVLTEEAMKQGAGIVVTSIGKHLELDYTKKMLL